MKFQIENGFSKSKMSELIHLSDYDWKNLILGKSIQSPYGLRIPIYSKNDGCPLIFMIKECSSPGIIRFYDSFSVPLTIKENLTQLFKTIKDLMIKKHPNLNLTELEKLNPMKGGKFYPKLMFDYGKMSTEFYDNEDKKINPLDFLNNPFEGNLAIIAKYLFVGKDDKISINCSVYDGVIRPTEPIQEQVQEKIEVQVPLEFQVQDPLEFQVKEQVQDEFKVKEQVQDEFKVKKTRRHADREISEQKNIINHKRRYISIDN